MTAQPAGQRRGGVPSGFGGLVSFGMCLACTCGDPCAPPSQGTTYGELGRGVFVYQCLDPADGACPDGAIDVPRSFPDYVAVEGAFLLTYDPTDDALFGETLVVKSTSMLVDEVAGGFVAEQPGYAGMGAYRGDELVDVIHLDLVVPELQITGSAPPDLVVGGGLELNVRARLGSVSVAGSLPFTWSATPSGVVDLVADERLDRVRVVAVAPGAATVTVSVGEASAAWVIDVAGSVGDTAPPPSTGDTGGAS